MLDASPHRAIDGQQVWHGDYIALAHQHFWIAPEEVGEAQPLVNSAGLALACDARLDNRAELLSSLELDNRPHAKISDAALVLHAYARWGLACVERLLGDFAFVLWDPTAHRLLLARDSLGGRELHYHLTDVCCVAASEIKQVLAHPAVPRILNEGKAAEHLVGVWRSQEETFFVGVHSLPPGHWLAIAPQTVVKQRYWEADLTARVHYRCDADYADHFRTLAATAVRDRLRTASPVGISLSGGLDSTTLAALAAPLLAQSAGQTRLRSFSYVFDEFSQCDERAFIEPVAQRYGLEARYIPSDRRWTLHDLTRWPTSPDAVIGDAYVLLFEAVLQAARESGCRLLLNGHFGDALFAGGRYWAADLLRGRRLRTLAESAGRGESFSWQRDLGVFGLWPLTPQPLRRAVQRVRPRPAAAWHPGIHPELARRTDLAARLDTGRRRPAHVAPDRWERYQSVLSGGWAQGIALVREWTHRHGLEIAMPLWDRRLVEFVLAIPADQLGRPQQTRRVQRAAMAGLLPEAVRLRPDKTNFYPLFSAGLLQRERAAVEGLLTDPQVVRRGWVRAGWLRSELAAGERWSRHGYPLWQALSLELWLQRHWPM
jgi:asparagine synthase (glutamine-hydrolysing)